MSDDRPQELAERRIVQVREADDVEPMDMEVFLELDHDGKTYALITSPVPTVVLFEVDEGGDEEAGEALNEADDETFDALRNDINDFLKQWNISIARHGTELRLSDELPEEVYADSPMLEIDSGEDDEPDSFLQLGEFDRGDKQYWLLMPTPPHLFAVELVGDTARFLEDEEIETLQPLFDEAMEEIEDDCQDPDCEEHDHDKAKN
ncbi:DUF3727 domain-containing protein [Myxococcota bacterium]|nr:DUF3727 domain-containing protein [Myxococcota bacterium]